MSVRRIQDTWWVDISYNGKRYRKRSPEQNRAGALAFEATLRSKLAKGDDIDEYLLRTKQKQLYRDYAWDWFEVYVRNGKKKHSVESSYRYILKGSLIPFFGRTQINRITGLQIEEFKSRMMKAGKANRTINSHLIVLSASLRCAKEWYNMDKMPKIEWMKRPPAKNDFLSDDECRKLLGTARGQWRDMILVALKTGIRLGELRALKWEDINWDNRTLMIQRAISRGVVSTPKSNKNRCIPLHPDVLAMFKQKRKKSGYIFIDEHGELLSKEIFYRQLKRISKQAGVRRIGWHLMRHTFASHLAMKAAPIMAIKELLGHADVQTTMRYAHLSPSALSKTIALLDSHNTLFTLEPHFITPEELRQSTVNQGSNFNSANGELKYFLPNLK